MIRAGTFGWGLSLAIVLLVTVGSGAAPSRGASAGMQKPDDDDDRRGRDEKEKDKEVRRLEALLRKAIQQNSMDEIAQYAEHIGSLATPRAMDIVLKLGERYPQDPVKTSVVQVLAWSHSHPECLKYFLRQMRSWKRLSVERLIILVDALDRIDRPEANQALIEALAIPDSRVVTGAVRALRHKRTRESVEAVVRLYGQVSENEDLLAVETRITLMTLTEQSYRIYEDWANWWLINKNTWKPPTVQAKNAEKRARTAVYRPDRDYDIPKLFGQEVASKRVVFVIDTSSSMAKEDPWEGEEGSGGGTRVRIERAKAELIKVVNKLRPDVHFNIVAYSTFATRWKDTKLVSASAGNKRAATRFVGAFKAEGHTNTLEAMLAGMSFKDLDTLILLSDGSPTIPGKGSLAEIEPILDTIRVDNRFKKITIHTLGFPGCKVSFMKTLAKDSGGTYAEIE